MSREIKFRAWDGVQMWHFDFETLIAEGFHGGNVDLSKEEVMQYTGLKDKSGAEIYEGDLLSVSHPRSKFNGDICKIEYSYNSFSMCSVDFEDETSETICLYMYIEVIGNIYENPELVKV